MKFFQILTTFHSTFYYKNHTDSITMISLAKFLHIEKLPSSRWWLLRFLKFYSLLICLILSLIISTITSCSVWSNKFIFKKLSPNYLSLNNQYASQSFMKIVSCISNNYSGTLLWDMRQPSYLDMQKCVMHSCYTYTVLERHCTLG